ncbi:MAG TPA: TetR/AcrR family transcriptional regulator [Streptosporangiaceae bacterium]|jgi:AcrR family transcriptional regulator
MDAKERLIEAAQGLLWDRGYTGTSPKAIQQQADAGQGSMYHHFAGKHELAHAAITRSAEQLMAEAEQALDIEGSAAEKIAAYLTRQRDVMRGCRIGRLAADPDILATVDLREPLDRTFSWLRERLSALIGDGQAAGEFNPQLDPTTVAAAIVATVQGGYVLARAAADPAQFENAIKGLMALLTQGSKA